MKSAKRLILAGLLAAGFVSQAQAVPFFGVSAGTTLVSFDSSTPGTINSSVAISGVTGSVVSIDVRPATGELYALSSNSQLYTINRTTGVATLVATVSTPVSGNATIDFNPTVDRIRIVSDSGQNLRVNPTTGAATVDGSIAFAAGDSNAGDVPNVHGIAYTNSFAGSTATTLFDFELGNNILATQNPPNNGTLNTVGNLGVTGLLGFDIFYFGNQAFGSTFASLYSINLVTGAASLIGAFAPNLRITDIAAAGIPEPGTVALLGLGMAGLLAGTRRRRTA
jgi:Domain of unknown function (DUF4394)/PEP-CTERM motif